MIKEREKRKKREKKEEEKEEEKEEITKEEVVKQLKKLKKGKAQRDNGIKNEARRLMPKEMEKAFMRLINKIWKGEIPDEWKRDLIYPIYI